MVHVMISLADVISAFQGINAELVGFLASVFATALIIAGYNYMFALDDHNKASQAKRAIGYAIVGAIVVAVAVGVAASTVKSIGH